MITDIMACLNDMRAFSAQLKCSCEKVQIKDGHGSRIVCPDSCPHGQLDERIARALVYTEIEAERLKRGNEVARQGWRLRLIASQARFQSSHGLRALLRTKRA